ncbi:MAG: murein biosynthesis integral membrane protein MurJ [Acidimicrobiales bacterium]|mgnify:FL=1|nr:murein biosynthesis integral membrane protein MurJ [Acidimicrobiales bacterium]MEC9112822.1 murein biosynthesis integral membrane protein MurJ [Actinomycetota bacterium]|tara:strand:+ start:3115 stop:4782 length:1668 start_codon:yes stop_codon:yes gene_type:complete
MRRSGPGVAAAGIGLSRFSGVARSVLVTNILGIGLIGDAFAAAQRVPNILQNLFGEGALSAAFVPEYSRLLESDPKEAGKLAGGILSFLLCLVAGLTAVAFLATEPITRSIAWGFTGERFDLTVQLVRIIILGTAVLVMSAWCLAILNSHGRFFLGYAAPVAWNICQIIVLIVLAISEVTGSTAAEALAWALVIGSLIQVLIQIPTVLRGNRNIRFNLLWKEPSTALVLRRFVPAVAGRGALQLSSFMDLALASLLSIGAASALAAAQAIYLLPVALIATSIVAVELPELSRSPDTATIHERVNKRLLQMLWLVGPILALYFAAGAPIADFLFNLGGLRNSIDPGDLTVIGFALGAYALGLPALLSSRLLQSVCFSTGDTTTPSRIALARVLLSAGLGLVLMFQFEQVVVINQTLVGFGDWNFVWGPLPDAARNAQQLPPRLGPVGLALGSAIGAWFEFWWLRKHVLNEWSIERLTKSGLWKHTVPALIALGTALALRELRIEQALIQVSFLAVAVVAIHVTVSSILQTESYSHLVSGLSIRRPKTKSKQEEESL